MTENKAIYSILDKLKPHLTDDTDITPRHISFDLANQRALFIRNELNKGRNIDPDIIQDLGCVEMEVADTAECCDITTGCYVMRTKLEIPPTIETHKTTGITRIGSVDKTKKEFSRTTFEASKWVGNGKYNTNEIFAYKANNRIYVISKSDRPKFLTHINIRGIFENPNDVSAFTNCSTGASCFSGDSKYPLKSWMYSYIEGTILNLYMKRYNLPADILNDGADNTVTRQ